MSTSHYKYGNYNARIGGIHGHVKSEDFSIDGRSWNYRDPYNQEMINRQDQNNEKTQGERINDEAYTIANPLYDYSFGQVRDAAKELGIDNVDKQKEVDSILDRLQNPTPATAAPTKPKKVKDENKKPDAKLAAPTEPVKTVLSKPAAEANAFVEAHNAMTIGNENPLAGIAASNQAGVSSPKADEFKRNFQLNLGKGNGNTLTFTEGITGTKPTVSTGFMDKYKDAIKKNLQPM